MTGSFGVDDCLIDGNPQPQFLATWRKSPDGFKAQVVCSTVSADLIVLFANAVHGNQQVQRRSTGTAFAKFDDSIREKTIRRHVQAEGFQFCDGEFRNFRHVPARKRFSSRQANGIHLWELTENLLDFVERQIVFVGHFPRIAHDASSVTAKCHGVRQESGPIELALTIANHRANEPCQS
jgi:hypothetical protein